MIPRPDEPVPALALPTALLMVGALALWAGSTLLALKGVWPWPLSVPFNTIAGFVLFTVAHEASHRTLSNRHRVNDVCGRIAQLVYLPHASFGLFRFCHMQHHRFTNHDDGNDPDAGVSHGSGPIMLLRFITVDLQYGVFYLRRLRLRPRREKVESAIVILLVAGVAVWGIAAGQALLVLGLWLLPSRLAVVLLAWSFDYLPHHGLLPGERMRATRNRVGLERVMTPLLLYQNYHLVHHLHPIIPFYRYIAVWRRNEEDYLEGDPLLCNPRGRELTVEEYRQLRELA